MAQLDIYTNSDTETSGEIPFLVDMQHDLHQNLKTRMMIPLVSIDAQYAGIAKLCPVFTIQGRKVFASIPEMAAYPVAEIGSKVANLEAQRATLFDAVDFLMHGF
ncbi:MAG: plasmid maintenance protein CcdB [Geobacteraceae bacterium]|nr:plasmid maintenance protein CcdB [Geobacteraceae bacterium]NTW80782.1 plasmid maintenance protein CcdB [Geobacteraceae bacterium]